MLMYTTSKNSITTESKVEQFRRIGLSSFELSNVTDILDSAIQATTDNLQQEKQHLQYTPRSYGVYPLAVTYNINTGDLYQYNISRTTDQPIDRSGLCPPTNMEFMKNSYVPASETRERTNSTRKSFDNDMCDDFKLPSMDTQSQIVSSRVTQLYNLLEGISDDNEVLITAKPKNRSYKIRKSNRYSRFRGVSLNGKKWQVMIMGPAKKKYFGAIASERDAAVLYDKLSILTNGLASKTNFNYRKSDLMKMMAELEYMQPFVSN